MAATIKIKNSSTAGAAPTSSDLVQGELAVNVTDKRLYTENASGTIVELGTNPSVPVTFPDGSASAPSLTNDGDTNTGIFFPAADTVGIATGGTERARVDSSGNLGLGVTPSAWGSGWAGLQFGPSGSAANSGTGTPVTAISNNAYYNGTNWVYINTAAAAQYQLSTSQHIWRYAASNSGNITWSEAMRLDASGNLGVGTTSPSYRLDVARSGNGVSARIGNGTTSTFFYNDGTQSYITGESGVLNGMYINSGSNYIGFLTGSGGAERARIDSSGNLLVGTTNSSDSAGAGIKLRPSSSASVICQTFDTSSGGAGTYILYNVNATNNGYRFYVAADGGIRNYSANNSNLSDERTKTDIQDAGGYLTKICAIPVRTFKYKDQTDDLLNLGVIAQEVEAIAPELVDVSGFGETPEDGVPLKAIYQTDLQYALMKCIQELKAEVDNLKAQIAGA